MKQKQINQANTGQQLSSSDSYMVKKSNCGAWCHVCITQNVRYTINNGDYVYTCLDCGRSGERYSRIKVVDREYPLFTSKKPQKIKVI